MCDSKFWNFEDVRLFEIIKGNTRIVDFISSQWDQEVWKRKKKYKKDCRDLDKRSNLKKKNFLQKNYFVAKNVVFIFL